MIAKSVTFSMDLRIYDTYSAEEYPDRVPSTVVRMTYNDAMELMKLRSEFKKVTERLEAERDQNMRYQALDDQIDQAFLEIDDRRGQKMAEKNVTSDDRKKMVRSARIGFFDGYLSFDDRDSDVPVTVLLRVQLQPTQASSADAVSDISSESPPPSQQTSTSPTSPSSPPSSFSSSSIPAAVLPSSPSASTSLSTSSSLLSSASSLSSLSSSSSTQSLATPSLSSSSSMKLHLTRTSPSIHPAAAATPTAISASQTITVKHPLPQLLPPLTLMPMKYLHSVLLQNLVFKNISLINLLSSLSTPNVNIPHQQLSPIQRHPQPHRRTLNDTLVPSNLVSGGEMPQPITYLSA